ncbi:MAG: metallophosphoesterase, partial [Verrucomicrobiota bacterium]
MKIIHLSDLHYRTDWEENHGVVLTAFFEDLKRQIGNSESTDTYLAISGDIAQAGANVEQYTQFHEIFDPPLNDLGISRSKRICIPGNHDVSRTAIEEHKLDHESIVLRGLSESQFNDYASSPAEIFIEKFSSYLSFQENFATLGIERDSIGGVGHSLGDSVGIFALNSAYFSSAGIKSSNGSTLEDKGKLAIDTRRINQWIQTTSFDFRILIVHHPPEYLTEWARIELNRIVDAHFNLMLSGHVHRQSISQNSLKKSRIVDLSAPPLFTTKTSALGYSIIDMRPPSGGQISFRQWTGKDAFVRGVNFSNHDSGTISFQSKEKSEDPNQDPSRTPDPIADLFDKRLHEALQLFSSLPRFWIEPRIADCSEFSPNSERATHFTPDEVISREKSLIIEAPPQFGLTCLARHFSRIAWRDENGRKFFLYLDAKELKDSTSAIKRKARETLGIFGKDIND